MEHLARKNNPTVCVGRSVSAIFIRVDSREFAGH